MSTSDERLARRASTELPETVNAADVTSWSDEVDVLVIGFGIAGGSAAVSAAAAGARVLVLERAAAAGGTSAMAGGHFYLGGGTAVQEATGHQDSPEEMYKYLVAVSRAPEHDKIREYCEGSVEHFNWLEDLGFQFERSFYPGKIVVPPGTEGLSYTGNEKVWPYIEQAKPAPRGHSVPVPGELGGAAMVIDLLVKRADELGVEIRYETGATNLVVEDGSVVGVSWKHFTETGAIKAKAVIIAAGGFAMNPEMVAEHTPALGQKRRTKHHGEVEPYILGNPNDDGLGIRLGVSAGGVAKNLDQMFITAAAYPPEILLTGIIVNNEGQRFVAEDSYHSRTSAFVLEQPDQAAYLVVDEAHTEMPAMPLIRFIDGWETVEEMEKPRSAFPRETWSPRCAGTTRTRRAARIRTSTSNRNMLRHKTMGRGPHSIFRWAGRCTPGSPWAAWPCPSTAKCSATTARRFPVCTPQAHARRTSHRTARATPAERSWAKAPSSVAARERTRPGPKPARGATGRRRAVPGVGRGAVRRCCGD